MTQTHTCPYCLMPLENKDTLRLKFLLEEDADLERHLIEDGKDVEGWWFNGKTSDGWGNTPEEAIDDAIRRKAPYDKKETLFWIKANIWKCTEDTHTVDQDYLKGFYFTDETDYLNGPYPTIEDAENARTRYAHPLEYGPDTIP